jgi:hypothetical protein
MMSKCKYKFQLVNVPYTRTIYYDMETAVEDAFRAPKEWEAVSFRAGGLFISKDDVDK